MPLSHYFYPITAITKFNTSQGRGSCYQQFASHGPHGNGENRFTLIFDEDIDFRVLSRLERAFDLDPDGMKGLLIVGERKGSMTFVFKNKVPDFLESPFCSAALTGPDRDEWYISAFVYPDPEIPGHLANPALTPEALKEATTWYV